MFIDAPNTVLCYAHLAPRASQTLCPKGSEGATYAMLTTFGNIALVVSIGISSCLAKIWDCSNSALARHQLSGLWKLALLTSVLPILPLVLLNLLPTDQKSQKKLQKNESKSVVGGAVFLAVLLVSLCFVFVQGVTTLSGAMNESRTALSREGAIFGAKLPLFA